MRDDGLRRLLEGLPREEAPPIDLDSLVRRLFWRRLRIAAMALGLLGCVAGGLLALRERPEPLVNLDLRVVDVGGEFEAPPPQGPAELNLP